MGTLILVAVVAIAAGVAFGSMLSRAKSSTLESALAVKQAELDAATRERAEVVRQLSEAETKLTALRDANTALEAEKSRHAAIAERVPQLERSIAELGTQLAAAREAARGLEVAIEAEKTQAAKTIEELKAARQAMSNEFKSLAAEILDEKSKKFVELNQANLGQLLDPVKVKLGEFQKKVEEVYADERTQQGALAEQLRRLQELNLQLSTDANNLTKALTGSSKMQGDWGELMLERILEKSGLRKGEDYLVQQNLKTAEGKDVRPDVLVKLPENRTLIIDSKVSLVAYKEYTNAEDDASRAAALKLHLDSVRKHVSELAKKAYEKLPELNAPDFVIMFVPLEGAFSLAISKDEKLWEEAYREGVLLVSPLTLLFVLRTVAQLWTTETQKKHFVEIAERGSELYDRLRLFSESLLDVGGSIDRAKKSYDEAVKRLSTGSGNVIRQAQMLMDLGVKAKKNLPSELLKLGDGDEAEKAESANA